jgi:hypothetical protein
MKLVVVSQGPSGSSGDDSEASEVMVLIMKSVA